MMDPILKQFTTLAGSVPHQKPTLPWISTFTGTLIDERVSLDGSYWAAQLRHTVRFGQAVETAIKTGATVFLEVGPGQALTQLVLQQSAKPSGLAALTSLGPHDATPADVESMLTTLGSLWLSGIEPDWSGFYSAEMRKRMALPTYPFERKSYWIAPPPQVENIPSLRIPRPVAREGKANGEIAAVEGESYLAAFPPDPLAVPQPTGSTNAQSTACRLIEKQVQLMAQQLETLRSRAGARKDKNGIE
jgi:acyl transferase domain-containing protein